MYVLEYFHELIETIQLNTCKWILYSVCAVTIELLSYVITSCSFYSSKSTYIDKNSHLK